MDSRKRGSRDEAPLWAWLLFGLSIGLAVALVVYLVSGDPGSRLTGTVAAERPPADRQAGSSATRSAARAETESAAEAEAEEEFSFFTLLPESEVVVPGNGSPARAAPRPAQEYIIQAGSFHEWADADRAQARLALLGIEAKVERAIVGNEIYHRVIIGPLSERGEIESTVRRLNAEDIDALPPRPVGN